MKTTPLTAIHRSLGARMTEFAGYDMPLSYAGLKAEHQAVRERVGIFDVSHMGEFIVRGPQALALVQHVISNDASQLAPGQAQYACLPNERGGIVDDLIVYHLPPNPTMQSSEPSYMLVVNASNIQKDFDWISQHNHFDAQLIDISEQTALLAVQGPRATEVLQSLTSVALADIAYYHCIRGSLAGVDNVLISATGYTGSGGFELYVANADAPRLWQAIMEAGQSVGIQPAGLGARDTLRLEMGYCLYGNDIDDTTNPLDAGLGWITKLGKEEFVGKSAIVAHKEAGLSRRLVGFVVDDRRAPRHGYELQDAAGQPIGTVTSGTHSPSLDLPIGLGYVSSEHRAPGSRIFINVGRKLLPATVTKLPFLKP